MKAKCFLALFLLFINITIFSQTNSCSYSLNLTIKDDHTQEVLEGCNVLLVKENKLFTADASGKILIKKLCKGKYNIQITHIGCDTVLLELNIDRNITKEIYLHHVKVELGEVVVNDQKKDVTTPKTTLKGNDVFKTRGLNLAQSLQQINGVRVLSTGANISKPIIHGLHSNRIVMVNNGVRLEGQQWGVDHAPEIDPFTADKFAVIKGAAAVKYGAEAMAGVVITEPKPMPIFRGSNLEINSAVFSNNRMGVISAALEGSNGKPKNVSYRIQASLKRGGNQKLPSDWLINTGVAEANVSFTTAYHVNKLKLQFYASYFSTTLGLYTGAHVENLADLDRAIKSERPLFKGGFTYNLDRPQQKAKHLISKLQAQYNWNSHHQSSVTIAQQENKRDEFDPRAFIALPEMSLSLGTTSIDALHNIKANEHLNIEIGAQFIAQQNVNNPTSSRIFIRNYENTNLAIFSTAQYQKDKLKLEAGLRIDNKHFTSFYRRNDTLTIHTRNFNNVTASVGAMYAVTKQLRLSLNTATAWRPPAPNELYANGLHQGLASLEIGNQNFKAEQSFNTNFQIEYNKDSLLQIDVLVYNNYFNNFIYLQPVQPPALTIRGYYPVFEYRQTNANLMGADISIGYFLKSNLQVTAKASLLRAKNTLTKDWIILMPADRYELRLKHNFKNNKFLKPYAEIGLVHVAEQTRIPTKINGTDGDYAPPPKSFNLVDFEAGAILNKSKINIGLSVYNLLNTNYREYLNRLRYFANEAGLNIALRVKIPIILSK
jgi:iron complex outermembrane receptor protein